MNNIDEIKARIDIVDLVSESVQLRRSGKNHTGFCPFHDNKRTPAFVVWPETGTWRCFGQCDEGGDIFKFVMKKEGWDFGEALRHLAGRAGVTLRELTPQEKEQAEENENLRNLLEDAVTFFRHNLRNTPAGQKALEYLHKRGLDDKTIETWGLGYAPHSWDQGIKHFKSRNYSEKELVDAGLVTQRDDGRIYDRFRHRVTFPIRDERGRMTGFGARVLNPDDIPKFLNSPQTVIFDKSRLLYGLDKARKSIRAEDQAVIVEGYLDVIALHQHGFTNAVSPMGIALNEHQFRMLKRRTRRIILALDADAAGDKATLRGLEIARDTMGRETEIRFDARGLMRQEARLQADIRVTTLPEGKDPDDVVNADPEEWQKIVEKASPIVIHVMESLARGQDLDDPKIKTTIAAQVMPLINDVPSAIERDTYVQRLARLLRVDERALLSGSSRPRPRPRNYRSKASQPSYTTRRDPVAPAQKQLESPYISAHNLEVYCLGILMRYPGLIYRLDRGLQKASLDRLAADDFSFTDHQQMMKLVLQSVDQDFDEPLQVILGSLPLNLMETADQILEATKGLEAAKDRLLEDLLRAILDLRRRNVNQNIASLRFLMQESQEKGDLIVQSYQNSMMLHTTTLVRLDQALRRTNDRSILNG